jgi:acetyl esterase/lipase
MISRILGLLLLTSLSSGQLVAASAPDVIDLWPPGKMPGKGAAEPEAEVKRNDGFHRITNVSRPTLTVFPAARDEAGPAPAVIICPGGGYNYVVVDKEGSQIAAWLNTNGVTAFVLKYRTPKNQAGALQDLQRSVSLMRARAGEWNIDPRRLGVIGFSAGGNVAAKASTRFGDRTYPPVDAVDRLSCRPDFALLVYPAYLDDREGNVSPDLNLKADIPPTLIVHTEDDLRFVRGSRVYAAALARLPAKHEFRLYPTGGHGYGLHCEKDACRWPEDAAKWLRSIGIR